MKDEYLKKLSARLKQKMKILTNNPHFLKRVAELRTKWSIPQEGFKTEIEIGKWQSQLSKDNQDYFDKQIHDQSKKIIKAREKGDLTQVNKIEKELNDNAPLCRFNSALRQIIVAHTLSPRWLNGIKNYLLTNDPNKLAMFIGPTVVTHFDSHHDSEIISIEIDADTTQRDIKAIWPSVKFAQKNLSYKTQNKFQPLTQFERNKLAYELRQQGLSLEEIAHKLSTEGKEYGYEDVSKMIERYKKAVDIN